MLISGQNFQAILHSILYQLFAQLLWFHMERN